MTKPTQTPRKVKDKFAKEGTYFQISVSALTKHTKNFAKMICEKGGKFGENKVAKITRLTVNFVPLLKPYLAI